MSIHQWARKVQAIAQNGLAFTQDPFDRERYGQLQQLVESILASELDLTQTEVARLWSREEGYATPKVDVRGGVFTGRSGTAGSRALGWQVDAARWLGRCERWPVLRG